ncbi:ESCRT-II complex, vps25 subunit [Saccharata proteae CBS 121410]|uniref:Vacuolar protein-sorting-associated protein 25 n=1 Tax=Saccharata proteae CBS 121410 TaxID=1314787 RepID=A0A6A5YBI7_9PEZI|nr:ESCRT-II complex, vps25 subunit [Saccharata proteae CBS 121410]
MATTTPTEPFPFPPHYSFPPFFTLQPVLATRTSQLTSWSLFVQSYCRHHRLFQLSLIDALETPLFHNRALKKRLLLRDARALFAWMAGPDGGHRAEWVDGGSGSAKKKGAGAGADAAEGDGGRVWVYWRRPEEWADVLEAWVEGTGQKGSVLTLYELTESDATASQEFHGMDPELLQKSLQVLVKRGRAQVFGGEDSLGVKFF